LPKLWLSKRVAKNVGNFCSFQKNFLKRTTTYVLGEKSPNLVTLVSTKDILFDKWRFNKQNIHEQHFDKHHFDSGNIQWLRQKIICLKTWWLLTFWRKDVSNSDVFSGRYSWQAYIHRYIHEYICI
jgi:hypothetical protein